MNRPERPSRGLSAFLDAYQQDVSTDMAQWVRPYPGLRSFEPYDRDVFFGRQGHTDALLALLERQQVIAVLGGSGSGKSSVVRAGIIPALTSTYKLEGRLGRWYVVHFKPGLRPTDEFCNAVWDQLCCGMVLSRPNGAAALAAALGITGELRDRLTRSSSVDEADKASLRNIFDQELFPGGRLSLEGVLWFACDALDRLDRELNPVLRSGSASLMLVIDQFEELFDPDTDSNQRDDVLALVTRVFEASRDCTAEGIYIVVTMRSEQLHRCAEFTGLSKVINGSTYLIDLVDEAGLMEAIARPARRVFEKWHLRFSQETTAPFDPVLVDWLLSEAGKLRTSLVHKPDQLPLMQHALRLIWTNAVNRWSKLQPPDDEELVVTMGDRPEWDEGAGVGFMRGSLNVAADGAFTAARTACDDPAQNQEMTGRGALLLRAFFMALARRDDRGNWARHLVTTGEILDAIRDTPFGISAPALPAPREAAFEKSLGVFIARGYITLRQASGDRLLDAYEVCHEALIRHWRQYQRWLDEARDVTRSLRRVADNLVPLEGSDVPKSWPEFEPYRFSIRDAWAWVRSSKERHAAGILSEYDRLFLSQAFGKQATFGSRWVTEEGIGFLRDRDSRRGDATKSLESYRSGAKRLLTAMSRVYRLVPGPVWDHSKNLASQLFNWVVHPENRTVVLTSLPALICLFLVLYFTLLSASISSREKLLRAHVLLADSRERTAVQAAYDVRQALSLVNSIQFAGTDSRHELFPPILSRMEDATRSILGGTLAIHNPTLTSHDSLRPAPCIAHLPDRPRNDQSVLVLTQNGYRGLGWVKQGDGGSHWGPLFYRDDTARKELANTAQDITATVGPAFDLKGRAIHCLSRDGSSVLVWLEGQPANIVALLWYPLGPDSERVAIRPFSPPLLNDKETFESFSKSFDEFFSRVTAGSESGIMEVSNDSSTLFLVSSTDSANLKIGFRVMGGVQIPRPSPYQSRRIPQMACSEKEDENSKWCEVRQSYEGQDVHLNIHRPADGHCDDENDLCALRLRVTSSRADQWKAEKTAIPTWLAINEFLSPRIREAGIVDSRELWIVAGTGQAWVFDLGLLGMERWAKDVLRMAGMDGSDKSETFVLSKSCQELQCDKWN